MTRRKKRAEAEATWWVQLNCTCPLCKSHLDLYKIIDHDELQDPCSSEETDILVNCPECEEVFTVTKVTW